MDVTPAPRPELGHRRVGWRGCARGHQLLSCPSWKGPGTPRERCQPPAVGSRSGGEDGAGVPGPSSLPGAPAAWEAGTV